MAHMGFPLYAKVPAVVADDDIEAGTVLTRNRPMIGPHGSPDTTRLALNRSEPVSFARVSSFNFLLVAQL